MHAGESSSFYCDLCKDHNINQWQYWHEYARGVLGAFIKHAQNGLLAAVSPERVAQLDVVSDILSQASALLQDNDLHPAAAAMLVGAALEEFLRNWVEAENLSLTGKKACINTYGEVLKVSKLITKQDVKDMTAWAGLKVNHAAHGEWEYVADRATVELMSMAQSFHAR